MNKYDIKKYYQSCTLKQLYKELESFTCDYCGWMSDLDALYETIEEKESQTMEEKILKFLNAWNEIKNQNIEITFDDGKTYLIGDNIEIVWNINNISHCYNP